MRTIVALNLISLLVAFIVIVAAQYSFAEKDENTGKTTESSAYISDDHVAVPLNPQDGSGVVGAAALTAMSNQTKVVIQLVSDPKSSNIVRPVHIHTGTCEDLQKPKYSLNPIESNKSETVVDAKLESLITGKYAINVHKSSQEMSTYVSCGTIPKAEVDNKPGE